MKQKIFVLITCALLVVSNLTTVWATGTSNQSTEVAAEVTAIDLSIHGEKEGVFTPTYVYQNPFKGQNTAGGVVIEFHAKSTGNLSMLGTIFSIMGSGDHDGRLYFTPGSYFGFNSANYGGYFDANVKDFALVEDYIKQEATIKIEIDSTGFRVFADDNLCYDQAILDDAAKGSGDYTGASDFTPVLNFLANADTLNFGYGSWWNTANADEAFIELSNINFRLSDGTVLLDQFIAGEQGAVTEVSETKAVVSEPVVVELPSDLKEVESINLAIHRETEGVFQPIYTYPNPFKGQDTSGGVSIEFTARSTWQVNALGTIFSIIGTGDHDGKLYFTAGSYLGFNSANHGGYFDANLKDYLLVEDFIKEQSTIKIEIDAKGFRVFSNGTLCYDQSILDDEARAAGDYTASSDFAPVLTFLANADQLHFGYGAWWNTVNADEAHIELSKINFGLLNGAVLLDKLMVDEAIVKEAEEISASVSAMSKVSLTIPEYTGELTSVLSGLNDVEYKKGISTYAFAAIPVAIVFIACVLIISSLYFKKGVKMETKKVKNKIKNKAKNGRSI